MFIVLVAAVVVVAAAAVSAADIIAYAHTTQRALLATRPHASKIAPGDKDAQKKHEECKKALMDENFAKAIES